MERYFTEQMDICIVIGILSINSLIQEKDISQMNICTVIGILSINSLTQEKEHWLTEQRNIGTVIGILNIKIPR